MENVFGLELYDMTRFFFTPPPRFQKKFVMQSKKEKKHYIICEIFEGQTNRHRPKKARKLSSTGKSQY